MHPLWHTLFKVFSLSAILIWLSSECAIAQADAPGVVRGYRQAYVENGIQMEFVMEHVDQLLPEKIFREGESVRLSFVISDTSTRNPVTGAGPAAWIDLSEMAGDCDGRACKDRIERYLSGGLFGKAEIDLNVFYVLTMNEDPTLSVVDPLFGYGGSKLLALVQLHARAKDWVLSRDKKRLFVSTPDAHEIAVVETDTWKVAKFLAFDAIPDRLVLQPDGHYLWVALQDSLKGPGNQSGVAVVNMDDLSIKAQIRTGAGAHDIVVDDDNRHVFVSNYDNGTVSIIDVDRLQKVKDVTTSPHPGFMAWSAAAHSVYVTHQSEGTITAIDAALLQETAQIKTHPGVGRIRFAPGGRLGFVVNPENNYLYIVDAAVKRIIQQGQVKEVPDQVMFTNGLAYIRHRGSELVLMVPLPAVGEEGQPIQVVDFPGGDNAPGNTPYPPLADGIAQTPGENAVVVANPLDKSIYFYKEGMAAPMGSFSNYGHSPRAVLVVDRSLRETKPGYYQTVVQLPRPGKYCVSSYMNSPRLGHCFEMEVAGEHNIELARTIATMGPLKVTPLAINPNPVAGTAEWVRFALHPHDKAEPITGLKDVQLLYLTQSGKWSKRVFLTENAKVPGVYEAEIQYPGPGVYALYVSCLSRGQTFNHPQYIQVNVIDNSKK